MHGTWIRALAAAALLLLSAGARARAHPNTRSTGRPAKTTPSRLPGAPALVRHESQEPPFTLVKPASWEVRAEEAAGSLRVVVQDPEARCRVELSYSDNRGGKLDALGLLGARVRELRNRYPDLAVSEVAKCKDGTSCAVATLSFSDRGVSTRGRAFFHAGPDLAVVRSYQAPADRLAAERPLLLDVLTNIQPRFHREAGPPPARLVQRRAPDGSLSVSVPADWSFHGRKGAALASARDGGAGFMFTSFQVLPQSYGVRPTPDVIVSPYRSPEQFAVVVWQHFGNRDVRALHARTDPQTAAACPRQIGRTCDAADVELRWVSPKGIGSTGSFKVLNARPGPTGQWFSIVAGIWGPTDAMASYLPTLERVAASFTIDDRYARSYIQRGVARLREMQGQTARAVHGLYDAIAENQRAYEQRTAEREAGEARWDDYRRGNSYWISDLEGGKVYRSDPWGIQDMSTGDRAEGAPYGYVHFDGQNPRHPSENMREVSSYEVDRLLAR